MDKESAKLLLKVNITDFGFNIYNESMLIFNLTLVVIQTLLLIVSLIMTNILKCSEAGLLLSVTNFVLLALIPIHNKIVRKRYEKHRQRVYDVYKLLDVLFE